jgi:hypothetical protein
MGPMYKGWVLLNWDFFELIKAYFLCFNLSNLYFVNQMASTPSHDTTA